MHWSPTPVHARPRSDGFPDPNSSGEIPKEKVVAAVVSNPQSQAAQRACRHLIPESGLGPPETATPTRTRLADALSFARCMRAHGFPSFPDPTSQGQLTPEMVTAAGIDLHQPKVLRAGLACVPASHGLLTPGGDRTGGTRRLSRPSSS